MMKLKHFLVVAASATLAGTPALARDTQIVAKFVPLEPGTHAVIGMVATKGTAVKVKLGVQTPIAQYYEYNPETCAEISPGMWTLSGKPPKHGEIANISGSYTSPPGDACAGMTYTTGVVAYTWTDSGTTKKRDKFTADWTTPDGEFDYPYSAKLRLVK